VTRKRRDPRAVADFVERFAGDLVVAGMPRMPARTFAALLSADEGCTAAQLAEQLQASPAAISGAVRYLEQVEMVARTRQPGERRDVYRLENDMWYEVIANRDRLFLRWMETLRQGADATGRQSPAGRRIDETRRFFDFVRTEMPALLARWRDKQQRPR
jgi:DNA-binding MarR family transcriptional regulator